jgi:hypothetical protein
MVKKQATGRFPFEMQAEDAENPSRYEKRNAFKTKVIPRG